SPVQVKKLHTITGHRDCIYTLQGGASADGFFSAAGDGMVVRWSLTDPENGEVVAKLPNSIYALHYHKPSGLLITGHNYEGIHLLDWQNKKETGSLQLTKAQVFDINKFDSAIIVATGDGTVTMVNPNSLTITHKAQHTDKSARTIAVNEVTGDIAVGYSDHFIRIFDEHLQLKSEFKGHDNSVFTLRYTPDGSYLISGSRDARLKVWDAKAGYVKAAEVVAHMYAINHIEFSPDGKHFVTCSMDKSIKVWDLAELRLLKVIDRARHAGHGTSVNKLLWTTYNNQLISASDDRTLSVWHIIF
ncbi:MAG TPA: WD40 repeat domain-containing protein, partial [Chryseosolibacter sp.]